MSTRWLPTFGPTISTHPRSPLHLQSRLILLHSRYVTLPGAEFQHPKLSPQSDLRHRVASRCALPWISSESWVLFLKCCNFVRILRVNLYMLWKLVWWALSSTYEFKPNFCRFKPHEWQKQVFASKDSTKPVGFSHRSTGKARLMTRACQCGWDGHVV